MQAQVTVKLDRAKVVAEFQSMGYQIPADAQFTLAADGDFVVEWVLDIPDNSPRGKVVAPLNPFKEGEPEEWPPSSWGMDNPPLPAALTERKPNANYVERLSVTLSEAQRFVVLRMHEGITNGDRDQRTMAALIRRELITKNYSKLTELGQRVGARLQEIQTKAEARALPDGLLKQAASA